MLPSKHEHFIYSWLTDIVLAACIIGIFYALWLGHHPLFTPDEGRYSEIAREMVTTGDYITPRLNGVAFLDKPALYYWLQASAIKIFGLKEWALRFWPALFGIIGCVATMCIGRTLFNRRTGWLAAIILATSPIYYGGAHYANLDLEVAVLISLTLFTLIAGFNHQSIKIRSILFLLAWVWAALAFLTKGMIALAFPIIITSIWLTHFREWRIIREMHLIIGPILFALIVLPWYVLVSRANPGFLHFFFITQQVSRFLAHGDFNNQSPVWFYLPIIFAGFIPWSIFILPAIFSRQKQESSKILKNNLKNNPQNNHENNPENNLKNNPENNLNYHLKYNLENNLKDNFKNDLKKNSRNNSENKARKFFLISIFTVLVFFSIPKSKTIGYILPLFPALSLIIANYLDTRWQQNICRLRFSNYLFFAFALIILPLICFIIFLQHLLIWIWLAYAAIISLCAAGVLFYLQNKQKTVATSFTVIATNALLFCLIFMGSATTINQDSIKPIAIKLNSILKPTDEIITYYKYYQDLPIYLQRKITIVADWQAADIPERDNWVRELWYGLSFQDTSGWLINEATFWQRWNSSRRVFVLLDKKRYQDFLSLSRKSLNHIKQQGKYADVIWVSNQ